jgi:hypothetical protein
MIALVLVTPVCGGIRLCGFSMEKKALGARPGILAPGSASSVLAVAGQRSRTGRFGSPYSHRKIAPQSRLLSSPDHLVSPMPDSIRT